VRQHLDIGQGEVDWDTFFAAIPAAAVGRTGTDHTE
jgi:sugar phosphate isomerase/epimerase